MLVKAECWILLISCRPRRHRSNTSGSNDSRSNPSAKGSFERNHLLLPSNVQHHLTVLGHSGGTQIRSNEEISSYSLPEVASIGPDQGIAVSISMVENGSLGYGHWNQNENNRERQMSLKENHIHNFWGTITIPHSLTKDDASILDQRVEVKISVVENQSLGNGPLNQNESGRYQWTKNIILNFLFHSSLKDQR